MICSLFDIYLSCCKLSVGSYNVLVTESAREKTTPKQSNKKNKKKANLSSVSKENNAAALIKERIKIQTSSHDQTPNRKNKFESSINNMIDEEHENKQMSKLAVKSRTEEDQDNGEYGFHYIQ